MGVWRAAAVLGSFLAVLALPLFFRERADRAPADALTLVVVTPHVEHLRYEFARGFSDWHERTHGRPVVVDYRRPGGTSEIRKQLIAQYTAALQGGVILPDGSMAQRPRPDGSTEPATMSYDLVFGGGSFEHAALKSGVTTTLGSADGGSRTVTVPISVPAPIDQATLDGWFGENRIGRSPLYDTERYWIGNALSGFGIAYNREVLARLGVPEPRSWDDLTDPRLTGWLALADPRQSGSVTTTYESILDGYGWDHGWRALRAMAANSRYFSSSSAKAVIDVSHGEAAAALAIDFYGRYESQAALEPGQSAEESRVGYIDPPGLVMIDPDPVSILRGAPHPELAIRFVEFLLSVEGQAIWQFPVTDGGPDALGPRRFELRRMPIRRVMYETPDLRGRFIDDVDVYEIAADPPARGWRSMIGPLFGAFAVDTHEDLVHAWRAMHRAREGGADAAFLADLEEAFYAMPVHEMPDGTSLPLNPENYRAIRDDWRPERDPDRVAENRIRYTRFFRDNYRRVVAMVRDAGY